MELPNIIFLDFDGVLCNPRACVAVGNTGGVYSYLDPIACLLVKKLCVDNNAQLVISSSWRIEYDRWAIQAILNANCPGLGNFMWRGSDWCTPNHNGTDGLTFGRGREINAWIKKHYSEFFRFVILDDESDMEPLMDSLVQCDLYDGIGFQQWRKADNILSGFGEE